MRTELDPNVVYVPSDDIVVREVLGEMIIVPLVSGMGDADDDLFTMNETGQSIWDRLDGEKSVAQIVSDLAEEYPGSLETIRRDTEGFLAELLKRKIIVVLDELKKATCS